MNDYIELRYDVEPCSEAATDVLAALLAEAGCESFVPDEEGLTAYVSKTAYDAEAIESAISGMPMDCTITPVKAETIEGRDWNSEWEKNYFQPIVIDDQCVIHSSFHTGYPKCNHDITIDPKMAFGTGHHATTSLIVRQLLNTDIEGCSVIDMGTGTGILAILAAMRGATPVTAIEIDPFACVNAVENTRINGHDEIKVMEGDASRLEEAEPADLFLANINRNVITADMERYAAAMKPGGEILLSGFYTQDIPVIEKAATKAGLQYRSHTERDNWACVRLTKPQQ